MRSELDPHELHAEEPPLWWFEIEIGRQARIALRAARALDEAAARPQTDFDGIFGAIQAVLAAAGNASKLLWPGTPTRVIPDRGQVLRERLGIPDDSPLRNRRIRNHLEHFDERLEAFFANGDRSWSDIIVGSEPGSRPDYPRTDYFRRYDPETDEVGFSYEVIMLKPIRHELHRIAELVALRHPRFGKDRSGIRV